MKRLPVDDDLSTIEAALKAFARLAREFRYGGLSEEWRLACRAREAFERVKGKSQDDRRDF